MVLNTTITVKTLSATQPRDEAGAPLPGGYQTIAENVPASVQVMSEQAMIRAGKVDGQARVKVFMHQALSIDEGSLIEYTDALGEQRTVKVETYRDLAGRGEMFCATGVVFTP